MDVHGLEKGYTEMKCFIDIIELRKLEPSKGL